MQILGSANNPLIAEYYFELCNNEVYFEVLPMLKHLLQRLVAVIVSKSKNWLQCKTSPCVGTFGCYSF